MATQSIKTAMRGSSQLHAVPVQQPATAAHPPIDDECSWQQRRAVGAASAAGAAARNVPPRSRLRRRAPFAFFSSLETATIVRGGPQGLTFLKSARRRV